MFQTDKAWGLQKVGIVSENEIPLRGHPYVGIFQGEREVSNDYVARF